MRRRSYAASKAFAKSVYPAIEVCETRFTALTGPGVPSLIADNAVASHLVLGPAIRSWKHSDLTEREVTLSINGERRASGMERPCCRDPIRSLHWAQMDALVRWQRGLGHGDGRGREMTDEGAFSLNVHFGPPEGCNMGGGGS
jgi:2-keto-4-pentenoate hydratase